jgi:tol-pal system protein YbgF
MPKLRILAFGALGASVLAAGLAGCAATTASQVQLSELQKRLDGEQRRSAANEHKLDELENRVFLLTDQVESQKVAAIRRSKEPLPIVTLKPDAAAGDSAAGDSAAETATDAAGDEVVFEGAARSSDPSHTRTVLRIDGTRVASRHSETDARVRSSGAEDNLGVAPAPSIHAAAPPVEHAAPAAEPLALYKSAYDDLRAGRHEAAERGFREFVRRFPHHDYADNAQYWLGECYYDQKRYDLAAPEFRAVLVRWPSGNKAPDAMLKLGYTLIALGERDQGQKALRELPATYPRTDAARLAAERLAQTSTEGSK